MIGTSTLEAVGAEVAIMAERSRGTKSTEYRDTWKSSTMVRHDWTSIAKQAGKQGTYA
jgi:hypothetical protein